MPYTRISIVSRRSGWDADSKNAVEIAKILEANGAAAVAVHGRTREEFYSGKADRNIIKEVKDAVKIPVIGNGDIFCADDAKHMIEYTGCDAVMVGRGAQGNPFIFRQINELLNDGEVKYYPTYEERIVQAMSHLCDIVEKHGEYRGIREARKHIAWYIKGMPNASQLKTRIFTEDTFSGVKSLLSDYMTSLEEKTQGFSI